jgi:hypothetical protein
MGKRSRLAAEVLSLAESLKCKDKLSALREEELREVDLETAAALGIERDKAAKIACRIRSASPGAYALLVPWLQGVLTCACNSGRWLGKKIM